MLGLASDCGSNGTICPLRNSPGDGRQGGGSCNCDGMSSPPPLMGHPPVVDRSMGGGNNISGRSPLRCQAKARRIGRQAASSSAEPACFALLCCVPTSGPEFESRRAQVAACEESGETGCAKCRANPHRRLFRWHAPSRNDDGFASSAVARCRFLFCLSGLPTLDVPIRRRGIHNVRQRELAPLKAAHVEPPRRQTPQMEIPTRAPDAAQFGPLLSF